jgi:multisubunit Na+/H+ antiporter MnhB subunit
MSRSRWLLGAALAVLAAMLAVSIWRLPAEPAGLAAAVDQRLASSGVSHAVTAVLLNFRSYDTLLELLVLLAAALGVSVVARPVDLPQGPPAGPVLAALVRLLTPMAVLVGFYVLWSGSTRPGGAFQAGAVWGAAGVLLLVTQTPWRWSARGDWLRMTAALGVVVFLVVGLVLLAAGRRFLEYPEAWAGSLILAIETASMVSIAFILATQFAASPPRDEGRALLREIREET